MKTIIITIKFLLLMTLITGILYPILIYGIAKIGFPNKSDGSFIEKNGEIIGSEFIAQKFDSSIYFQPRPSAVNYLPIPSGASNFGPTSKKLKEFSDSLKNFYKQKNLLSKNIDVPTDAIFTSGSGVDPHISPDNAFLPFDRVSKIRGFDDKKKKQLRNLINNLIENPQFGFLGVPRINVLILNLELDKL